MSPSRKLRSAVLIVLGALSLSAQALAEESKRLAVPAGPLTIALKTLAEQSGVEFFYSTDQLEGLKTPGVQGEYTAEKAVLKLLEGTNLKLTRHESGALVITMPETAAAAVQGSPDGPLQLARAESNFRQPSSSSDVSANILQSAENREELEEIVVTGSHIRGLEPAGSKIIVIDRGYIDKSGYATVQDVLKTLPQNFGGGISELGDPVNTVTSGGNYNKGTAVNLRGLGPDSTLILVNGRRQPLSGVNGAFVDISSIAATAIERIEVLTDGASAIYGSDAVGGVVNFILRRDFEGAETRARFGTYGGDADEMQASQLLGANWSTGGALIGYQYLKRERLARIDRNYTATDDLRRFGGSDFRSTASNPGNILCPSAAFGCTVNQPAFAIPSGQDGASLTAGDLLPGVVNYSSLADVGADLLPEQMAHAAFFNVMQRFGERVEVFADGRYNTRQTVFISHGDELPLTVPASNPFFVDPFGGRSTISVSYNFADDLGPATGHGSVDTAAAVLGTIIEFPAAWQLTISGSYGEENSRWAYDNVLGRGLPAALADPNPETAFNPFGDGTYTNPATLDRIRTTQIEDARSTMRGANAIADGPLFALPGGSARLAVGIDYREEDVDSSGSFAGLSDAQSLGRYVSAAFAELALPIVDRANARPGVQSLAISIAGRYEDYSDFGTTLNPKVGMSWAPIERLRVRGTWGRSFKAPRLIDLLVVPGEEPLDAPFNLQSPSGPVNALVRFGANPDLQEETANVWTAGLDFSPGDRGLNASVTYYSIDYKDRVQPAGPTNNPFSVLFEEDEWQSVIIRDPTREQIDAICNAGFLRFTTLASCLTSTPAAIVDLRLLNLAEVNVRGLDLSVSRSWQTSRGTLGLGLDGSYMLRFDRRVATNSPTVDLADTLGNPPAFRGRASASWTHQGVGANAFVNYTGSYNDSRTTPARSIDSWTTVDLSLSYRFSRGAGFFDDIQIALNAVNVLDREPPFADVRSFGYDTANANLYGRIVSVLLTKGW